MIGVQGNVVSGFITGDPVAVQIKYGEGKDQKDVTVCSAYFPSDSVEMLPPAEFRELLEYSSEEKLEFLYKIRFGKGSLNSIQLCDKSKCRLVTNRQSSSKQLSVLK